MWSLVYGPEKKKDHDSYKYNGRNLDEEYSYLIRRQRSCSQSRRKNMLERQWDTFSNIRKSCKGSQNNDLKE